MTHEFVNAMGHRIVLRYRLPVKAASGAPTMTDVLGILEHADERLVTVRRADGSLVTVDRSVVVVWKVVPPRPIPRRDMRHLEQAAAAAWQPVERREVGGWVLRAAGGFTKRANSALALTDPQQSPRELLPELIRWYGERALPPLVQLVPRVVGRVDAELERAGWSIVEPSIVLTVPVTTLAATDWAPSPGRPVPQSAIVLEPRPDPGWLSCYAGGDALPATAHQVLAEAVGAELCFATVGNGDRVDGIARGAVSADPTGRRWLGITTLKVAPHARRSGVATRLMTALAGWGEQHDAAEAYVQIVEDNEAAQQLSARLGFVEHHRYHYRRLYR